MNPHFWSLRIEALKKAQAGICRHLSRDIWRHGKSGDRRIAVAGTVFIAGNDFEDRKPTFTEEAGIDAIRDLRQGRGLKARDPTWTAQQVFDHARRDA